MPLGLGSALPGQRTPVRVLCHGRLACGSSQHPQDRPSPHRLGKVSQLRPLMPPPPTTQLTVHRLSCILSKKQTNTKKE